MRTPTRTVTTLGWFVGALVFLLSVAKPAIAAEHVTTPCFVSSASTCTLYSVISASKDDEIVWKIYELNGALRVTIKPYPDVTGGMVVAEGDIDGDGDVEWITAPETGGAPIKTWSPLGELEAQFGVAPSHPSIAIGNFNSDSDDEIAITSRTSRNTISVYNYYISDAARRFARERVFTPSTPGERKGLEIAAGDIDNDGQDDIVAVSANGKGPQFGYGTVTVFGHTSEGLWGEIASRQVGEGYRMRVGNVTGDDADEIVLVQRGNGTPQHVFLYQWDATQTSKLTELTSFAARVRPWSFVSTRGTDIELGDLTGDDHLEIITYPNRYPRGPVVVWQYTDVIRAIAHINTMGPQSNGINLIARNAAPDKDTRYHAFHDELIVASKGGSQPTVKIFRYLPHTVKGLEFVRSYTAFHPSYRGEVRLNSPTD
ncbi:MAG: VCBS repeat-containing protein [Candidatus Kerfeldbacteria bacterium]|nr:VCBS repeat-containing protein [Candidatus Kerfeldbacteria bacterium]